MNNNDHAQQHADATRRTAESIHRIAAGPTLDAQQRARATEAAAKSDALRAAGEYHRSVQPLAVHETLRPGVSK